MALRTGGPPGSGVMVTIPSYGPGWQAVWSDGRIGSHCYYSHWFNLWSGIKKCQFHPFSCFWFSVPSFYVYSYVPWQFVPNCVMKCLPAFRWVTSRVLGAGWSVRSSVCWSTVPLAPALARWGSVEDRGGIRIPASWSHVRTVGPVHICYRYSISLVTQGMV